MKRNLSQLTPRKHDKKTSWKIIVVLLHLKVSQRYTEEQVNINSITPSRISSSWEGSGNGTSLNKRCNERIFLCRPLQNDQILRCLENVSHDS